MFSHLPNQIVYVRHPECIHNVEYDAALARGISTRNSPLTERGEIQARITAEYLKSEFGIFDAVFASDFIRTHTIPVAAGYNFHIEPRIGERWHGELNERGSVFFKEFPLEEEQYHADYYNYKAPGGESCSDVEKRMTDFLLSKELFNGVESMLLSGHGISGLCFRKVLLESKLEEWHGWFNHERLGNASVSVFERREDGYDVKVFNHKPWLGKISDEHNTEA